MRRTVSALTVGTALLAPATVGLGAQEALTLDSEWAWVDFEPTPGFPAHATREMVDVAGTLWLRTDDSVHWFDGFRWHSGGSDAGLPSGRVSSIAAIGEEDVLVAVGGLLYRGGKDGFDPVDLGEGFFDRWTVIRAVADADEVMFVTGLQRQPQRNPRVFRVAGGEAVDVTVGRQVPWPMSLWASRDRVVHLDTQEGLVRWEESDWIVEHPWTTGRQRATTFANGASGSTLVAVGDFLAGWQLVDVGENADSSPIRIDGNDRVQSLTRTVDGRIASVHENGRVRAHVEGVWLELDLPPNRRTGVHFVHVDLIGDLWFATEGGLHMYPRTPRRWSSIEYPNLDPRNRVNDLLVLPSGELWIATHDGVVRWQDGREVEWVREIAGERLGPVTALAHDSTGGVWIGGGATYIGAARLARGVWERLAPPKDGTQAPSIESMSRPTAQSGSVPSGARLPIVPVAASSDMEMAS